MFQQTPQKRVLFPRTLSSLMVGVFVVTFGLVTVLNFVFASPSVSAATNSTINFQARLQSASGAIVPDGFYNACFNLYNAASGGSSLWAECYYDTNGVTAGNDARVQVRNGYLTVNLGQYAAFPGTINWDQDLWVTLNIGGTTQTATPTWDGEMNPRLKLTSVPYAFRAGQLAQFNQSTGFTSTLNILQPTVGNQSFQLADQGAAGTYTICVQNSASCGFAATTGGNGYIQNRTSTPQTANLFIQGVASSTTAVLQAGASSTNVLEIRDSSNATKAYFAANGNLYTTQGISASGTIVSAGATANLVVVSSSSITGQVIKNVTNQTADSFQIQDGNNNVLTNFTASGDLNIGNAINRSASRLISDSFESGNTGLWTVDATGGGTAVPVTTDSHTGKYGLHVTTSATSIALTKGYPAVSSLYVRSWMKIMSMPGGLQVNYNCDGTPTCAAGIGTYVESNGTVSVWSDFANTTIGATAAGVMTTGTWHNIESAYTSGNGTGTAKVWVDGVLVISLTGLNNGTTGFAESDFGEMNGRTVDYYLDDVAVDTVATGASSNLNVNDSLHVAGTSSFGGTAQFNGLAQFGDGTTGAIRIGDGYINKTVGTGFVFNSSVNASSGFNVGATNVIDSSRNLTNIANYSGSGTIQSSGTTGSSYIMSALGLGTTNPQVASALTLANGKWISSVDAAGTGYINMFQVNAQNQIQVGAALSIDGGIVLPTNGGQMTLSDLPIDSTATNGTKESYTLRVGSANALTVYGEADGAGNAQNIRVAIGSSINPQYSLDVGGDINTSTAYRMAGTIGATTTCSSGNVLTNQVVQGGIVTGGSCAVTGAAATLQTAYDNSTSPATITTSSATKGVIIKAGPTFDSTALFQVQNAAGGNAFSVNTSSNAIKIGAGSTTASPMLLYLSDPTSNANGNAQITGNWQSSANWGIGANSNATDSALRIGVTTGNGGNTWNSAANVNLVVAGTEKIQPTAGNDSTTAFMVQNAAGSTMLNVDTTNGKLTVNQGGLTVAGLANPANVTLATSATGGSLPAATYYYRVSAAGPAGESMAMLGTPVSATTSGTTSKNTFSWNAVANATSYKVYRTTDAGATWFVNTLPAGTLSIIDNGTTYTWATSGFPNINFNTTGEVHLTTAAPIWFDTGNTQSIRSSSSDLLVNSSLGVSVQSNSFAVQDNVGYNTNLYMSNTGATTFRNRVNSTTALQVQNAAGFNVFSVDTATNQGIVKVGTNSALSTPSFLYVSDYSNNAAGNATIVGNWNSSNNWGIGANSNSTTDNAIRIGATSGIGVNTWSTTQNVNITVAGTERIQPTAGNDSTTAFQVQNAAGASFFTADSTTQIITTKDINVGSAGNHSASRLFSDGFESGNFGLWNQASTGAPVIDTAIVRNGRYSAKLSTANSSVTTSIPSSSTVFTRGYFYSTAHPTGNSDVMVIYNNAIGRTNSEFTVTRAATTDYLCYVNNGGLQTCSTTVLPLNQWNKIELAVTANSSTGSIQVKLNDAVVISFSGNTGSNLLDRLLLGDGGATQSLQADDISADTVSPGDSSSLNVNDSLHIAGTSGFSGNALFSGTVLLQSGTNSTSAFQIQNSAGSSFFTADSSNQIISTKDMNIGNATDRSSANRLFSDDFESGNLNKWTTNVTGPVAAATDQKRNGKYSVKITQAGATALDASVITPSPTVSVRGYVYASASPTATATLFGMYNLNDATGIVNISRNTSGMLCVSVSFSGTQNCSATAMPLNQWSKLELIVTSSATTTGSYTLYLNDVSILTASSVRTNTSLPNFDYVSIGSGGTPTQTFWIDDFAADTQLNGSSANLSVNDSLHVGGTSSFGGNMALTGTFLVQNTFGGSFLNVDINTNRINIGSSTTDANAIMLVLDSYNQTSDPTGVNGAMYYSTAKNRFRCYENGAWKNCETATYLRVSTDTNTSVASPSATTMASLGFNVDANQIYSLKCSLYFTTPATTTGFGVGVFNTGSSYTGAVLMSVAGWLNVAGAPTENSITGINSVMNFGGSKGATNPTLATVETVLKPTTTTSVAVGWNSEISGQAVTLLAGSWCMVF